MGRVPDCVSGSWRPDQRLPSPLCHIVTKPCFMSNRFPLSFEGLAVPMRGGEEAHGQCRSVFMGYVIWIAVFAAWLTHVVTCLADGLWGFLIAGAIVFPIGIIHGVMIWF